MDAPLPPLRMSIPKVRDFLWTKPSGNLMASTASQQRCAVSGGGSKLGRRIIGTISVARGLPETRSEARWQNEERQVRRTPCVFATATSPRGAKRRGNSGVDGFPEPPRLAALEMTVLVPPHCVNARGASMGPPFSALKAGLESNCASRIWIELVGAFTVVRATLSSRLEAPQQKSCLGPSGEAILSARAY